MITEESCDTDWSNDAKNSALITGKLHFTAYSHRKLFFYCNNILQYYSKVFVW